MKVTQLLTMRRSKGKTRFRNRFKTYKKLLHEIGNNVAFEKTKQHELITSELEIKIVLACCNAFKYFLFAIILLCLFSSK